MAFSFTAEDDSGPNDGAVASGDEDETPKNVNIVSRSADKSKHLFYKQYLCFRMKTMIMSPKIVIKGRKERSERFEVKKNLKVVRRRSARRTTRKRNLKKIELVIRMNIRPANVAERRRKRKKRRLNHHHQNQQLQHQQNPACPLLKKFAALLI